MYLLGTIVSPVWAIVRAERRKVCFALICLVFLGLRSAAILTSFEECLDEDEFKVGMAARELLRGSFVPYYDLKTDAHTNGHLALGILAAPVFALFGESLLSLKLVALVLAFATFAVWVFFVWDAVGFRAAMFLAVIWTVSPTPFVRISLMAQGNHPESNLLTGAALWLFVRGGCLKPKARSPERNGKSSTSVCECARPADAARMILLGMVCGFGAWFCFDLWLTVAVLLALWYLADKLFFLRRCFLLFVLGFCSTGWLLVYDRIRLGSEAIRVFGRPVSSHIGSDIFGRLWCLLAQDLPDSFFCFGGDWVNEVLYAGFVVSVVLFVYFRREVLAGALRALVPLRRFAAEELPADVVFPVFAVAYAVAYSVTDFGLGPKELGFSEYRYLVILYPHLFAMAAVACARIHPVEPLLVAALTVPNLGSSLALIRTGEFARAARFPGFAYEGAGELIAWRFRERASELIGRIDPQYRHQALCGLGQFIGWEWVKGDRSRPPVLPVAAEAAYTGLGKALGSRRLAGLRILQTNDPATRVLEWHKGFQLGAGFIAGWEYRAPAPGQGPGPRGVILSYLPAFDAPAARPKLETGYGWGRAERAFYRPPSPYPRSRGAYAGFEPPYWKGFGLGLRWWGIAKADLPRLLESLSGGERQRALTGYGWLDERLPQWTTVTE